MAERLHRSSDVPSYDTYPAEVPGPENSERPASDNLALPPSALEERARQVGTAMGKVVVMLRRSQRQLKDIGAEKADEANARINVLADTARTKAQEAASRIGEMADAARARSQELMEEAAARAQESKQAALNRASELRERAKINYYRARLRANQIARDYPVQVVLAAGAVGMLVGIGLRIWRANREY